MKENYVQILKERENSGVNYRQRLLKSRVTSHELSKYVQLEAVHRASVNSLDVDLAESRYLLSGAADGAIAVHDLTNCSGRPQYTCAKVAHVGKQNRHGHSHSCTSVQWYPLDSGIFTSSGMDKTLKIWDTNRLVPADQYKFDSVVYGHHVSAVMMPTPLIAVALQTSYVKLIDMRIGSASHTLTTHRGAVLAVRWSPRDEHTLATASDTGVVQLWDVRRAKAHLFQLDSRRPSTAAAAAARKHATPGAVSHAHTGLVNGLCYSTDGLHLITSGTDDAVRLWSTISGAMLPVNYGQVPNDGARCRMVAYCGHTRPDLIFVPADNTILVFDVFSGDLVGTLRGHYNEVTCCLYNAYTQHVYSGATDHSIVVWVPQQDNITAGLMTDDTPAGQPGPGQRSRANLMADSWSDDEA